MSPLQYVVHAALGYGTPMTTGDVIDEMIGMGITEIPQRNIVVSALHGLLEEGKVTAHGRVTGNHSIRTWTRRN